MLVLLQQNSELQTHSPPRHHSRGAYHHVKACRVLVRKSHARYRYRVRTGDGPQGVYGIGVYQVEDEAAMRDLLEHDPANGLLRYEVFPMARAVVGTLRG